jgi:hypothetical protein
MSGRHLPDFDCIGQYLHYREASRRVSEPPEVPGSRLHPAQIARPVIILLLAFLAAAAEAQSKQTVPIVEPFEGSLPGTGLSVLASYKPLDFKMEFSQPYALSSGIQLSPHDVPSLDVLSKDGYVMSGAFFAGRTEPPDLPGNPFTLNSRTTQRVDDLVPGVEWQPSSESLGYPSTQLGDARGGDKRQGNPAFGQESKRQLSDGTLRNSKSADFNRDIYYKNKLEFSLETGWLPNNIPFVFDFLVNSPYTKWPLSYTLVPNIASLRWQLDNIWGWGFLRGNTDFIFSASYTAVARGPETRYFAFNYGIRRNFIQRNWRIVPYFDARGGVGNINAKGPYGVEYAQGQDLTFTLMMGSGARYNFNSRYSISAGMTYMHVSNFYLSEPRYEDFGINVYGPIVGIYMRLGKEKRPSAQ